MFISFSVFSDLGNMVLDSYDSFFENIMWAFNIFVVLRNKNSVSSQVLFSSDSCQLASTINLETAFIGGNYVMQTKGRKRQLDAQVSLTKLNTILKNNKDLFVPICFVLIKHNLYFIESWSFLSFRTKSHSILYLCAQLRHIGHMFSKWKAY